MMHEAWKGIATTGVGLGTAVHGLWESYVNHAVFAQWMWTPEGAQAFLGGALTLAGTAWTWWLVQRERGNEARRKQEQLDADARRDQRVLDAMASIKIMIASNAAEQRLLEAERQAEQLQVQQAPKS